MMMAHGILAAVDTPDPDEPLSYADIAAMTGLSASTLGNYKMTGLMPPPDASPVPDRPRWKRSTIVDWIANRPGRGRPGVARKPRP